MSAVESALVRCNRYPDHGAEALRTRLADHVGVARERIGVGCGSVGLLQYLCLAYAGPGTEVAFGWRSFEAYPIATRLVGADAVHVPLRRCTIDVDALAGALSERTRLVLIATPNNPTGTALRAHELLRLADQVPDDCLLVLDEAYREFATGEDVPDGLALLGDRPNVAVLRTFSKAYGLAAFRVGYLIAAPDVVATVDKARIPFDVGGLSQVAALAALDREDEMSARVAGIVAERRRVVRAVRSMGLAVPDPQGNFVWLPVGDDAMRISDELERRGVVTRPFAETGIRVTIGTATENDAFLRALADVVEPGDGPGIVATAWLDRLDAVEERLVELAHRTMASHLLTEPDPKTGEQWDIGQVFAHLAEFGRYWVAQLDAVIDAPGAGPVPFGRVQSDPRRLAAIEQGRHRSPIEQIAVVRGAIDILRARLAELRESDWRRVGRHQTLGDLDVPAQLEHFHVGHYEEHADQLDRLAQG